MNDKLTQTKLVETMVDYLNSLVKMDPKAMTELMEHRVPCNVDLTYHPAVQVIADDPIHGSVVGMLGIINGFYGTRPSGRGYIEAVFDIDTKMILYFRMAGDEKTKIE